MEDKIDEIKKRLSEISLYISRVPIETKRGFISLANAEFSGDYGMLLKWLLEESIEYQYIKSLFFDKLQNMENKIDMLINKDTLNEQNKEVPQVKKTFGRRIEGKKEEIQNGQP